MAVAHRVEQAYQQALAGLPAARRNDADVTDVRWMLEELRVSLFAQTLGTQAPGVGEPHPRRSRPPASLAPWPYPRRACRYPLWTTSGATFFSKSQVAYAAEGRGKAGTVSGEPPVRRRLVGGALRRYRENVGYTLQDAARVLECDRSKISRIETGQRGIRPKELRELLAEYGVPDSEQAALVAIASRGGQRGWWHPYADVLPGAYLDYVIMESAAVRDHDLRGAGHPRSAANRRLRPRDRRRRARVRDGSAAPGRRGGQGHAAPGRPDPRDGACR